MNVNIINMAHSTYHGKKETHHHKEVVVSCECHCNPKNKLAQAGSHENGPSTNSGKWKQKCILNMICITYRKLYEATDTKIALYKLLLYIHFNWSFYKLKFHFSKHLT